MSLVPPSQLPDFSKALIVVIDCQDFFTHTLPQERRVPFRENIKTFASQASDLGMKVIYVASKTLRKENEKTVGFLNVRNPKWPIVPGESVESLQLEQVIHHPNAPILFKGPHQNAHVGCHLDTFMARHNLTTPIYCGLNSSFCIAVSVLNGTYREMPCVLAKGLLADNEAGRDNDENPDWHIQTIQEKVCPRRVKRIHVMTPDEIIAQASAQLSQPRP